MCCDTVDKGSIIDRPAAFSSAPAIQQLRGMHVRSISDRTHPLHQEGKRRPVSVIATLTLKFRSLTLSRISASSPKTFSRSLVN